MQPLGLNWLLVLAMPSKAFHVVGNCSSTLIIGMRELRTTKSRLTQFLARNWCAMAFKCLLTSSFWLFRKPTLEYRFQEQKAGWVAQEVHHNSFIPPLSARGRVTPVIQISTSELRDASPFAKLPKGKTLRAG